MVKFSSAPWSPAELSARVRRAAARFSEPITWMSLLYLVGGVFTSLGVFVLALVVLAVSLPLTIVGIGIPLAVGALSLIVNVTGYERTRARRVGVDIEPRPVATGSMLQRFRDPSRWRHVGFALSAPVVFFTATAVTLTIWGSAIQLLVAPVNGLAPGNDSWLRIIVSFLLGGLILLIAPWCTRQIATLVANYTSLMVGPDAVARMQQQVDDLASNRDEILTAVSSERQRIERNLHDGVQQQLVALGIDIGLARAKLDTDPDGASALLDAARDKTRASIGELRVIGQGLHPTVLTDRGLEAALVAVAANSSIPASLRYTVASEPGPEVAEAVYFAVSEAVTNAMKHSAARQVAITVDDSTGPVAVWVYDDGTGGVDVAGSGIVGIAARVRGLDGEFTVDSPPGGPTTVYATVPNHRSSIREQP